MHTVHMAGYATVFNPCCSENDCHIRMAYLFM